MNEIAQTQLLYKRQRDFEKALTALLLALWARLDESLRQKAVGGIILPSAARGIIAAAQDDLSRLFVGAGAPLSAAGVPLSPYTVALLGDMQAVQDGIIAAHSAYIAKTAGAETFAWLGSADFLPAPTPRYDPLHLWVDPKGYRLSDRIWSADMAARQKIDRYLTYNIQVGTSAAQMSRDLKAMLLPDRVPLVTARPYGVNVSFDAMRLARTEIARAHTEMTFIASAANPFVDGMDWALSAHHPRVDVCDKIATIGMAGQRLREPYPLDTSPRVIEDSHAQCLCVNLPNVGDKMQNIATLSERRQRRESAPVTPINAAAFKRWAYG